MRNVSHILERKGANIISVAPNQTVMQALTVMAEKNIGSVLVMEGDKYVGLLTERDYARKVILKGRSSTDTLVKDIMSADLPEISPLQSLDECMQIMSNHNVRYLPVFSEAKICGIISIIDVVTETLNAQKETIDHLQHYIQS
ncbi:MAG: CBS domain-containing protein [Bacteroidetes bacterium]|nr:CBS domain-containing protein [Bacteroidota bacterium]